MRYRDLIANVERAERALEAQARRTATDWHRLRAAWHGLWTPWRIVLAGFAAGFVAGRTRPSPAAMDGLMRLLTTLAGLLAAPGAQAAAAEAEQAGREADTTPPATDATPVPASPPAADAPPA